MRAVCSKVGPPAVCCLRLPAAVSCCLLLFQHVAAADALCCVLPGVAVVGFWCVRLRFRVLTVGEELWNWNLLLLSRFQRHNSSSFLYCWCVAFGIWCFLFGGCYTYMRHLCSFFSASLRLTKSVDFNNIFRLKKNIFQYFIWTFLFCIYKCCWIKFSIVILWQVLLCIIFSFPISCNCVISTP